MGSSRWCHWNFSSSYESISSCASSVGAGGWILAQLGWAVWPCPALQDQTDVCNVSLCPQITRVDGKKLLLYREQFGKILQRTLHLTCKQGYILSCNLLHHLLRSATLIYPTEYCSVPGGFDKPLSEYFPIKARIFIYLGLEDLTSFVDFWRKRKPYALRLLFGDFWPVVAAMESDALGFEM